MGGGGPSYPWSTTADTSTTADSSLRERASALESENERMRASISQMRAAMEIMREEVDSNTDDASLVAQVIPPPSRTLAAVHHMFFLSKRVGSRGIQT